MAGFAFGMPISPPNATPTHRSDRPARLKPRITDHGRDVNPDRYQRILIRCLSGCLIRGYPGRPGVETEAGQGDPESGLIGRGSFRYRPPARKGASPPVVAGQRRSQLITLE